MPNELSFNENCIDFGSTAVNNVSETALQPNPNYVVIKSSKKVTQTIQLVNSDGTSIPINLSTPQKKSLHQNKAKSVNDLFSTVIANKCKICSFLCEDLEQIKKHISTKHPEYVCILYITRNAFASTSE